MIHTIIHILLCVLFFVLSIDILYIFTASVAGFFLKKKNHQPGIEKKRIAVLITSFKEDAVIIQTAKSASNHNYPAGFFDVYLAADQLQPSTLAELKQLNIHLQEVHFETGSKARSLNYLLNNIEEDKYDIAVILDGDNIMEHNFLEKINKAFQENFRAVQGHRTAKNKNTPVATLDAISEEINNHLFRKAQRALHFSSALIGSGMAFEFKTLKRVYNKPGILDNPACDREVDFEMMKAGIVVEYLNNACIFDEKVSGQQVYENQRRRWMESQVMHLKLFFSKKERVVNKTKDYWNKLFINLLPPRILFIAVFGGILSLYFLQYIFNAGIIQFPLTAWIILLLFYVVSMLLSIPRKLYTANTFRAVAHLPLLLLSFLKAATSMKSGQKKFVHTPKTFTGRSEN